MAEIKITIPNDKVDRVLNGMCGQGRYQETIKKDGKQIANPETKKQFAKRMVVQFVKNNVIAWEANQAINIARSSVIADVDKNINIL